MSRRRFWLAFGAGILVAVGFRYVDLHPLVLPTSEPERVAAGPDARVGADAPITLWVDPALLEPQPAARRASARDWGLAWSNLLDQEFGAHRIEPLPESASTSADVIVVTAGGARAAGSPQALAAALADLARAGKTIVLELPPPGPLADLAGLTVPAEATPTRSTEPLAPGPDAPAWLPAELAALPAPTLALAARASGDGARVLLRRGADDALSSRQLGGGAVIGLAFDLARLLTGWQQGEPDDEFRVVSRWSERTRVRAVQSLDLVTDPRLLEAVFPFADLVERLVADEIRRASGLPGWWPIPDAAPGGFVLTHDEEGVGDPSAYQAEYVGEQGSPTTFFVVPGHMRAPGAARLRAAGAEVGLHWDRGFPEPRLRKIGLGLFEPLAVREGLAEQLRAIARLAEPERVLSHRLHGLLWGEDWSGTFRSLASAGLELDSSLGPTGDVPPGYPFGTGLPFHPLDDNGRPFALWELPFTFQDDESMQRGDTARLLAANAKLGHGFVVPIFHSSTMTYVPSVDRFEEWLEAPSAASAAGHWRGRFADLLAFLDARAGARLELETCGARLCRFTVRASGPGQALQLAASTGAGALAACLVDGSPRAPAALPGAGAGRLLLPIAPGEHRVELRYGEGS